MNAKVTAATGRVNDNGIISDITPSPRRLAQTHTPLLRRHWEMKALCGLDAPSPPPPRPPTLPPALPAPDPQPAHPAGQTCMAGQGLFSHVPLAPSFFFLPLRRPPRPALSAASASQARKYYTTETTLAGDHLLPANTAAHIDQGLHLSKRTQKKKPRTARKRETSVPKNAQ